MTSKTQHTTSEAQRQETRQVEVTAWLEDHRAELDRLNTERDRLDQAFRWLAQARGSTSNSERERTQNVHATALRFAEVEAALVSREIAAATLRLEMLPDPPDPAELARVEKAASEAIATRDALREQAQEAQQGRAQLELQLRTLNKQQAEAAAAVETRRRQAGQTVVQAPLAARRMVVG